MLHGADGVTVASRLRAPGDLEESEQRIAARIQEIVADILERRIAAIAGPGAQAGRDLERVHERHAEDPDVEVERLLHVVGVQREVVDAARKRPAVRHGRSDYRIELRRTASWLLLCVAPCTAAQQLEPRAYSNVPVGLNFFIAGYTYSSGGLATDPALPLDNAKLDINAPFVAYAHAFDAWGKSAKFDAVVAAACLSGTAESKGVPVSRDICGGLDPALRVTVNLSGAPAMGLAEFRSYRQDLIVGVSLQVGVPLGQYDPDRLVNLGTHRWSFRPEIGVSKRFGVLTAEAAVGASFYSTNDDFLGGQRREQDPVASAQLHLIFELAGGGWLALNATYYAGGRSTVNGVEQNDEIGNSRLGATFAWPLDRNHSIKLHASDGISARVGSDFTTFGVAWQYRWGAGF
jgi:hypothetical protein